MDSSTDALLAEWDVVNPIDENTENAEDLDVNEEKNIEDVDVNEERNAEHIDFNEESTSNAVDPNEMTIGSGIDEVSMEQECNDSTSSSDIDIIEEPNIEDSQQRDLDLPVMRLSFSTSFEDNRSESTPSDRTRFLSDNDTRHNETRPAADHRFFFGLKIDCNEFLNMFLFSLILGVILLYVDQPMLQVFKLQEEVNVLQAENMELKHQVQIKAEKENLFLALEDQIMTLKSENMKLSSSMHILIDQFEEQTAIFMKENEQRDKNANKEELDKLRDQINLLQIDNDELQQQLVRIRYAKYRPYAEETSADDSKEPKSDTEESGSSNNEENSLEYLTKEIQQLKKKMFDEVESLKHWEKSMKKTMHKLGMKFNKWWSDDGLKNEHQKPDLDKDEQGNFKKQKRNFNWSWKEVKNNLKNTFDNFNVSRLFSKYVTMDQKKVSNAMETVGSYFQKARKVLQEDVKSDVLEFFGELKKKWKEVKKSISKPGKVKNDFKEDPDADYNNDPQMGQKHSTEEIPTPLKMHSDADMNSWVFERAAFRSEERHQELEDEEINWFLQKHSSEETKTPNMPQNRPHSPHNRPHTPHNTVPHARPHREALVRPHTSEAIREFRQGSRRFRDPLVQEGIHKHENDDTDEHRAYIRTQEPMPESRKFPDPPAPENLPKQEHDDFKKEYRARHVRVPKHYN